MSNIIKAPDVMADNQGAKEINQDNYNIETENNAIPPRILDQLIGLRKHYFNLYLSTDLVSVSSSDGIHLRESAFLATFKDYYIEPFNAEGSECAKKLSAEYNGVRFFCLGR